MRARGQGSTSVLLYSRSPVATGTDVDPQMRPSSEESSGTTGSSTNIGCSGSNCRHSCRATAGDTRPWKSTATSLRRTTSRPRRP